MRTYYIFNINKETSILTKDSPYMLYKSLETIYHGHHQDFIMASNLYNQISQPIDKEKINKIISSEFDSDDFYSFSHNFHKYYNRYSDEECTIEIKNSFLICHCNKARIRLLKKYSNDNYFACDFENKDYFWLNEIYC